jgi:hypothetical protein
MERQRRPKVDLSLFENEFVTVLQPHKNSYKWEVKCKQCKKIHLQTPREIQNGAKPRTCDNFKPHNWSGLEKQDLIMRRDYGITLNEYHDIIKEQGGGCYICGKKLESGGKRLAIDHDHITKKVRGVLCFSCNKGLGLFYDNIHNLEKAVMYLKDPPYAKINKYQHKRY